MRIRYIREFLELASTLNYTEATKRLHITQPALSKHVDAMERMLDVRLLTRASSGMELTDAGKAFWLKESSEYGDSARNLELVRRACERVRRDLAD